MQMDMTQALFMLVPTVLGGVVGSVGTYFATWRKKRKAQLDGMRVLMRLELREMHRRICVEGGECSADDKQDATDVYEVYSSLGGNGAAASLYQDIMSARVTD